MRMNHFVTTYFSYYLQERDEYLEYFSEDFVAQFDDLAWECMRMNKVFATKKSHWSKKINLIREGAP
jgi:hypothetical protein